MGNEILKRIRGFPKQAIFAIIIKLFSKVFCCFLKHFVVFFKYFVVFFREFLFIRISPLTIPHKYILMS